jgi:hypothetical protein
LHDPWAEEVPLTLNSTSTDWRALSAEESSKGENSDDVIKPNSNLIDLSEPEKSPENLSTTELASSAAEISLGVNKLDLSVDTLNFSIDSPNIGVGELNIGIDEHSMGIGEHDIEGNKHDTNQYENLHNPVTHSYQGKMEFYSREPPPLCGEDFAEDSTTMLQNQSFSGSYEVMGDDSLTDIHGNLCSAGGLNLDASRITSGEREDSSEGVKSEGSVYGGRSVDRDDPPGLDEQREDNLYSQYSALSDSEESEHNDNFTCN